MSVMLTSTKGALRKKSARPVKSARKRSDKPKQQGGPGVSAQNVKMWQWTMDDTPVTLIFRKDTMEIWINDAKATVMDSFSEDSDGAVLDFECLQQKGRITMCRKTNGELDHLLTINGKAIAD